MNEPVNITSAEQGGQLDIQNQYDFRKQLNPQLNEFDQLRNQRKMDNLVLAGATQQQSFGSLPNEPINADQLSGVKPLNIPTPTPQTAVAGLSGATTAVMEQGKTALQQQAETDRITKEAEKKASESTMKSTFNKTLEALGMRSTLQEENKITEKTEKRDKLLDRMESLDRAEQNELRALETQTGMTQEQKGVFQREIMRKYSFEKADVALEKLSAQRDLDSAYSLIEGKMNAILEPLKLQLDFDKFFYQENKDAFNKAEQREFELLIRDDERAYKTQQDIENTRSQMLMSAVQQGAPASVIQAINKGQTVDEIIQGAGQYAGDILERQKRLLEIQKLNTEIKNLNVGQITNPDASKYGDALGIILGSNKLTKDQKQSVISAVNNGQDPFTVIKNQAKDIMGQTNATKVANYEVARDTLNDIGNQLSQFYALGGQTSLIKGNFENVVNNLGKVKDPKLVVLATQIQGNLQVYRNAISGTAYSEQEGKDIASIFPGINKSETLNTAILTGRSLLFDAVIDSSYRTVLGSSYDDLKKAENAQQVAQDPLGLGILKQDNLQSNPLGI
jgi:hypothetical protein